MYTINNMPAKVKSFVVARDCDGEFWFWGTWDSLKDAEDAAWNIGGQIFNREVIANI